MEKLKKNIKELLPYLIIILVVIVIKIFIVAPIKVNGPSMNNTLHDGDIMILDEISYRFSNINRFDIVVIKYEDDFLIKRVVGLPGEKIEYKNNKLYVNGKYIKESFNHKKTEDFKTLTIPDNYYFVLGDNRIDSTDSRMIGPISRKYIKGKAKLVLFPFKRFGLKN